MNLHLENFAKIKNSDIKISDFTVLVGKPSTNKSYVMKLVYSVYEVNKKSILDYMQNLIRLRELELSNQENLLDMKKIFKDVRLSGDYKSIIKNFLLSNTLKNYENKNAHASSDREDFYYRIALEERKKFLKGLEKILEVDENNLFIFYFKNILNSIFKDINSQISPNFTIKLNKLSINYKENKFKIEHNISEKINNVLFVETPLLLELEKFITKEKFKTPYHIESLLNFLEENFSFKNELEDEFINSFTQKIENIINGNIKSGSHGFEFESKSGKNYNIINTPSGVKSFGLIQYLIKNKALLPNSVLFWEEPEVHLHPEWQKKLIDIFLELIQNGIKIFISTHSPYITDYLNARVKKLNLEDKIAFNLLGFKDEEQSIVKNTIIDESNWDLLQSELLDPLEEIGWEYL